MSHIQEVFDRVKTHLLEQHERSISESESPSCAYRGYDGLKCAVGCLISDEHYSEDLEGEGANENIVKSALKKSGINTYNITIIDLLLDLQGMHDTENPDNWRDKLNVIAEKYGLT